MPVWDGMEKQKVIRPLSGSNPFRLGLRADYRNPGGAAHTRFQVEHYEITKGFNLATLHPVEVNTQQRLLPSSQLDPDQSLPISTSPCLNSAGRSLSAPTLQD